MNHETVRRAVGKPVTAALVLAALALVATTAWGAGDLMRAAYYGELDHVKQLLAAGTPVDSREPNGTTPLMAAALEGYPQVVELLLASGAAVNARTTDGQTPLMYAAINGSPDIVNLLLARRADLNARDKNGLTALTFATRKQNLRAKELLLQAGAK